MSVIGLIEAIGVALKMKVDYKILNTAKNEIPYQSLDYEKIKKLGWRNEETVASTAMKIFRWYLNLAG
jgi:dTDP-D-glucose 4,6-dehydratase